MLRANMTYMAQLARSRTKAQAKRAFLPDRRNQSYSAIEGLGPLAASYRTGASAL